MVGYGGSIVFPFEAQVRGHAIRNPIWNPTSSLLVVISLSTYLSLFTPASYFETSYMTVLVRRHLPNVFEGLADVMTVDSASAAFVAFLVMMLNCIWLDFYDFIQMYTQRQHLDRLKELARGFNIGNITWISIKSQKATSSAKRPPTNSSLVTPAVQRRGRRSTRTSHE